MENLKHELPTDNRPTNEKLVYSSYTWRKEDGSHAVIDLLSIVNSTLLSLISYGLHDKLPLLSRREIKNYRELRKLPDTEGAEIVDSNNVFEYGTTYTVFVRSLGREGWKNKRFNRIDVKYLCKEEDSEETKKRSIGRIIASCNCPRNSLERAYTDARYERISTVFCRHVCLGLNHLANFHDTASFDFFGEAAQRTLRTTQAVVKHVTKKKLSLPDYELEYLLDGMKVYGLDNRVYWTQPLRRFIYNM